MEQLRSVYVSKGHKLGGSDYRPKLSMDASIDDPHKVSAVNRIWGGDKRLALYGYTLETINMLLLPMIETK